MTYRTDAVGLDQRRDNDDSEDVVDVVEGKAEAEAQNPSSPFRFRGTGTKFGVCKTGGFLEDYREAATVGCARLEERGMKRHAELVEVAVIAGAPGQSRSP